jgi:hypothetical protein
MYFVAAMIGLCQMLGPMIGFLVGGMLLDVYVDFERLPKSEFVFLSYSQTSLFFYYELDIHLFPKEFCFLVRVVKRGPPNIF